LYCDFVYAGFGLIKDIVQSVIGK